MDICIKFSNGPEQPTLTSTTDLLIQKVIQVSHRKLRDDIDPSACLLSHSSSANEYMHTNSFIMGETEQVTKQVSIEALML